MSGARVRAGPRFVVNQLGKELSEVKSPVALTALLDCVVAILADFGIGPVGFQARCALSCAQRRGGARASSAADVQEVSHSPRRAAVQVALDVARPCLDNANKGVRDKGVELLVAVYKQTGPALRVGAVRARMPNTREGAHALSPSCDGMHACAAV